MTVTTDRTASPDPVRRLLLAGVWALPVYGVLLALSTLTHQPDYTTDFAGYADYVTTPLFLVSHLGASIFGAALGIIGTVSAALLVAVPSGRPARALVGAAFTVIGNVLNTSVFGVAAFGQPAIGRAYEDGVARIVGVNDDVYGPELVLTAVVGLLFFIAGAVLLGGAIRLSDPRLRGAGIAYAVSLPLFVVLGFAFGLLQPVAGLVLAAAGVFLARRLPEVPEVTPQTYVRA